MQVDSCWLFVDRLRSMQTAFVKGPTTHRILRTNNEQRSMYNRNEQLNYKSG